MNQRRIYIILQLALLMCAVSLVPAFPARAGDKPDYMYDQPGKWNYTLDLKEWNLNEYAMTPADLENFKMKLTRLAEIVHATEMLNPPRGVDAIAYGHVDPPDEYCDRSQDPYAKQRIRSVLQLSLKDYFRDKDRIGVSLFPATIKFDFNNPQAALNYPNDELKDEKGRMIYVMPAEIRKVGGYPLYDNQVMVITRGDKPLWLPVSQEQCLRARIKQNADTSAGGVYTMLLDMLKKELYALSPDQRRADAYTGAGIKPSGLCAPSDEGARPLVTFNPDFFDPVLPRTAVQLISIHWSSGSNVDDFSVPILRTADTSPSQVRSYELMEALDYKKIASLLDTPAR